MTKNLTDVHGDPALAERVRGVLGDRSPVAVATVSPGQVRTATVGAPLDADVEIGSISKGITGMLYVEAIDRGEVAPTTRLGDLLPLGDAPAARLTLASLSTHRSGLPRLPTASAPLRRTLALWRSGANPYGEDLDALVAQARQTKVGRPRSAYSNVGFELLGHGLAQAAGLPFAALVRTRIADPLGLTSFYLPATASELRPTALIGSSRGGRAREPWTGEALGPAGGIRASIPDLARLIGALLDGTAPGARALDPVGRFSGRIEIGAAWITLEHKGTTVTWHNGGTGGFRSWLGLDRAAGTGAAIVSATTRSVDRQGFALLASLTAGSAGPAERRAA